jgi:hypothetical protein
MGDLNKDFAQQKFMNSLTPLRGKNFKLMLKIVYIARLVILKCQRIIFAGLFLKQVVDLISNYISKCSSGM